MASYIELTEERKRKILEKNGPTFHSKIDPDVHLLTNMVSKKVITWEEKEDNLGTEGPARRKDKLLHRLIQMALLPFIIFCIFLCNDMNRRDIVETDWGLSLHHLKMQRDEMMNQQEDRTMGILKVKNGERWRWTADLSLGITAHREFYQRELMKGRLFDIKDLDLGYNRDYDMERCRIHVVPTLDELVSKPETISPEEMLQAKEGKARPRTALLSGPPGAGKSSLIKYYVYKWSQLQNGEGEWDLIVILNVSTLVIPKRGTTKEHIKEAIRQSVEGREDKEAILKSLDDDNMNILIVPDGLDECRDKTTRQWLNDVVYGCYKGYFNNITVFAVCRSGLCPINESFFNRRMNIDGFTIEEGRNYVERFHSEIWKPQDDDILEYIDNNTKELEQVLMNPLCAHIFSVVTADGTLKLTKGKILRRKELFQAMEKTMKKRQQEKNSQQFEDDASRFYNLCLYTLLEDIRTFDNSMFEMFEIDKENHAYMTFMTMKQEQGSRRKQWKFNHESFHEYFGACALEALPTDMLSTFLVILCYRSEFRNTLKLLISALGSEFGNTKILSNMIRGTLLLQHNSRRAIPIQHSNTQMHGNTEEIIIPLIETPIEQQARVLSGIEERASALRSSDPLEVLLPGGSSIEAQDNDARAAAEGVWRDITGFFEDGAVQSQECGLFYSIIQKNANSDLMNHIYECLNETPEEMHIQLFQNSIGCLLPSKKVDDKGETTATIYRSGETRWSMVQKDDVGLHATSWCLNDMTEAFKQHQQSSPSQNIEVYGVLELNIQTKSLKRDSELSYPLREWTDPSIADMSAPWTNQWSALLASISECQITTKCLVINLDDVNENCAMGFSDCIHKRDSNNYLRHFLARGCLKMFRGIDLTQGQKNNWRWKTQYEMLGAGKLVMRRPRHSRDILTAIAETASAIVKTACGNAVCNYLFRQSRCRATITIITLIITLILIIVALVLS